VPLISGEFEAAWVNQAAYGGVNDPFIVMQRHRRGPRWRQLFNLRHAEAILLCAAAKEKPLCKEHKVADEGALVGRDRLELSTKGL
jgi:hypothetical protein